MKSKIFKVSLLLLCNFMLLISCSEEHIVNEEPLNTTAQVKDGDLEDKSDDLVDPQYDQDLAELEILKALRSEEIGRAHV